MDNKGQVTAFVILGLVIVLGVGVGLFINFQSTENKLDANYREYSGTADKGHIENFVESCIASSTKPLVVKMASQGGFIDIPVDFYMPQIPVTGVNPRMVSAVAPMTKSGLVSIPYVYYNGEDYFPTLEEMEDELSFNSKRELIRCLDNFDAFDKDLIFTEVSSPDFETKISEDEVSFTLNYEIKFEGKGGSDKFTFDTFYYEIPLRIGKLREVARQIVNYQADENFLEYYTTEILAISDLPYEGIEFDCFPKGWTLGELEEKFKPYLMHNFRYLKFKNTKYSDDESFNDYYKNLYTVDFTDDDFSDIRVETMYNNIWDLNLDVTPKEKGNIVKPIDVGVESYLMCVKNYHHRYDMMFPVMFRMVDNYNGETLIYNFAIPVSLRKNQPYKFDLYVPYGHNKILFSSEQYCGDDELLYPLEIRAYDDQNQEYIANVSVEYTCGSYHCDIGVADYPRRGNIKLTSKTPKYEGKFPECSGGVLSLSAPGYVEQKIQINTMVNDVNYNTQSPLVVDMVPIKKVDYVVQVATDVNNKNIKRELFDDEVAVITLTDLDTLDDSVYYYPSDYPQYQQLDLSYKRGETKSYAMEVLIVKAPSARDPTMEIFDEAEVIAASRFENISISYNDLRGSNMMEIYALSKSPTPSTTEEFYDFYMTIFDKQLAFSPVLK